MAAMTATREVRTIHVVDIIDPGHMEERIRPYRRRFEFSLGCNCVRGAEDAANPCPAKHEAWLRYNLAMAAGFTATAERVLTYRELEGAGQA